MWIFKKRMKHLVGCVSGPQVMYTHQLEPIMIQIAKECNLTVVNSAFHQFEPFGVTGVLVLSESHFSVHTYPEDKKLYLDIFCCSETFDPDQVGRIILRLFEAESAKFQTIDRLS